MPALPSDRDAPLPDDLAHSLAVRGFADPDEGTLRRALEQRVDGYNLFKLTRAAARRWKCRYRILLGAGYYDGQSSAEAYGRALLAALGAGEHASSPPGATIPPTGDD